LGKALDFTIQWAAGPAFDPAVRLIAIDCEAALIERAAQEKGGRLLLGCVADVRSAAETLIVRASGGTRDDRWRREAGAALGQRPGRGGAAGLAAGGRAAPGGSVPRAPPVRRARSGHGAGGRRRRVCPVGPEHAAGAPPAGEWRRRRDRVLASVRARRPPGRAE